MASNVTTSATERPRTFKNLSKICDQDALLLNLSFGVLVQD